MELSTKHTDKKDLLKHLYKNLQKNKIKMFGI